MGRENERQQCGRNAADGRSVVRCARSLISACCLILAAREMGVRADVAEFVNGYEYEASGFQSHTDCPQYFLIGQMKCSTTTLFKHLKNELDFPEASSIHKSMHIFDQLHAPFLLDKEGERMPIIDGTTSLLRTIDAPLRIKAFCKYTTPPKFVVTLCDPTYRTWSHFKHTERADQMKGVLFFRDPDVRQMLTDETLPDAYRECVRLTLPQIKACMDRMSFRECAHTLYGEMVPGVTRDPLGNIKPCSGVIFSSMYTQLLENWFEFFPQEDFLIMQREEWLKNEDAAIQAVSKHLNVPFKRNWLKWGKSFIQTDYSAKDHEQFSNVTMPSDVEQVLSQFFKEQGGWENYVNETDTGAGPAASGNQFSYAIVILFGAVLLAFYANGRKGGAPEGWASLSRGGSQSDKEHA